MEHSWSGEDGSGFIDLVLEDQYSARAVVECKRVRDSEWLFFSSSGSDRPTMLTKAWVTHYARGQLHWYGWKDVGATPQSPEAEFCALRGQAAGERNTLLERIGGELVFATEALAAEQRDFRRTDYEQVQIYFSVIVTTAQLKLATFNSASIGLKEGVLSDAAFMPVPYLRFRKQLSVKPWRFSPEDARAEANVTRLKENTIFVVNSEALPLFLKELQMQPSSIRTLS